MFLRCWSTFSLDWAVCRSANQKLVLPVCPDCAPVSLGVMWQLLWVLLRQVTFSDLQDLIPMWNKSQMVLWKEDSLQGLTKVLLLVPRLSFP